LIKNLQQNTLPPLTKYYKPMISGLFDVYNFGTANALRVEGIVISVVKQVLQRELCQN
jgi:hypothetical protein